MSKHLTEEQKAENRALHAALDEQVCHTPDGVRQTFTTSLSNLAPGITPAPGLQLEFSNIPIVKNGQPILAAGDRLCISQLSMNPALYNPKRIAALDPLTQKQFEHLKKFPLLEYQCSLIVQYGRFDQVSADEALAGPIFCSDDEHTIEALAGGFMDVIEVKPDTHQKIVKRGQDGVEREVREPIKRTQLFKIKLYDISRAMGRQIGKDLTIWSVQKTRMRYIRKVGQLIEGSYNESTDTTHIVIVRMPSRGVKPARTDRPVSVGAAGRNGRGLAIIIPIQDCKVAEWTYQTILLPGFDYSKEKPEVSGISLMVSWLSMCPTPTSNVAFMDELLEGEVEAITSDQDEEGLGEENNEDSPASADEEINNVEEAADCTENIEVKAINLDNDIFKGLSDDSSDNSEVTADAATEQPEGATAELPATEIAAEATEAEAAPATETHVEFKPATADLLD